MTARYLPGLTQNTLAGFHVEIEDLLRFRWGFVGESHVRCVEFVARGQAEMVGGSVEVDLVDVILRVVGDDDARQCVLAFQTYDSVLEGNEIVDVGAGLVRQPLFPVLAARIRHRGTHYLEVDGIAGVGVNIEIVAGMLDGIEFVLEARRDEYGFCARRGIRGQVAILARGAFARADEYVGVALRFFDVQEITVVGLFVDKQVVLRARADDMMPDALGALVVVPLHVVKGFGIGGPDHGAVRGGDRFRVLLAAVDCADTNVVILRPEPVDAVRDEFVIRAVFDGRNTEEFLAFTLEIAIEEDRLIAPVAGSAYENGVLAAFTKAHGVGKFPVGDRDRMVIFLDASAHLLEKLLAQCLEVPGSYVVIRVFGIEMLADVRVEFIRVAQNLLPVFVAHPGVVVDACIAMLLDLDRALFGGRRCGREAGKRFVE